jgi:hypothetical protein
MQRFLNPRVGASGQLGSVLVPRYHFHIRTSGGALVQDEEGVHLPDIEAAREEARLTAAGFSADTKLGGYDYSACHFEIVSDDGRETITVRF